MTDQSGDFTPEDKRVIWDYMRWALELDGLSKQARDTEPTLSDSVYSWVWSERP